TRCVWGWWGGGVGGGGGGCGGWEGGGGGPCRAGGRGFPPMRPTQSNLQEGRARHCPHPPPALHHPHRNRRVERRKLRANRQGERKLVTLGPGTLTPTGAFATARSLRAASAWLALPGPCTPKSS